MIGTTVSRFVTTRWSLVQRASAESRESHAALEQLCRTYRPPVLAYVRANGYAGLIKKLGLSCQKLTMYAASRNARSVMTRPFLIA